MDKVKKKAVFSWLLRQLPEKKMKIIIFNMASLINALLTFVYVFLTRIVIDSITAAKFRPFVMGSLILVVIFMVQMIMNFMIDALVQITKQDMAVKLRDTVLSRILHGSYEEISKIHTGDLLSRMISDVQIIAAESVSLFPEMFLLSTKFVFAVFIISFAYSGFIPVLAVLLLLMWFFTFKIKGRVKNLHEDVQKKYAGNVSFLQEILSGILEIKTSFSEEKFQDLYQERQKDFMRFRMKRWISHTAAHAVFKVLLSGMFFGIMFAGCLGVMKQYFTLGSFLSTLLLLGQLQRPLLEFPSLVTRYFSLVASAERIMLLEDVEEEIPKEEPDHLLYEKMENISFTDVCFSYPDCEVLRNASVTINKGEMVAIRGRSGSGKSTFFLLLLSIYHPQQGKISFRIENREEENNVCFRHFFTYVPQKNLIFSGTVRENITYFDDRISEEDCWRALKISCAEEFITKLPNGMDTLLGEGGTGLSEGQKQRLSIARAILCDTPVILLDEATSALDEENERQVLSNIRKLKNKTILIATHRKTASEICDRVLLLNNGRFTDETGEDME